MCLNRRFVMMEIEALDVIWLHQKYFDIPSGGRTGQPPAQRRGDSCHVIDDLHICAHTFTYILLYIQVYSPLLIPSVSCRTCTALAVKLWEDFLHTHYRMVLIILRGSRIMSVFLPIVFRAVTIISA